MPSSAKINEGCVMHLQQIDRLIKDEYAFFLQERNGWSLTAGPQDLELVAHALRVLLHAHMAPDFLPDYLALVDCQNSDGGWSPFSAGQESTVWVSAFCGLMLIRGNHLLKHERLAQSVRKAIDYFLDTQHQDGRWVDPRWADLDTTSHPISFFNVVRALGEAHRRSEVLRAWEQGANFIIDHQSPDGGWYDNDFHPSGVEITAHLIQDALIADLAIDNRVSRIRESCAKGTAQLYAWQAEDGSWDEENIDHTMDCTRSLMVVTRILDDKRGEEVILRGLRWIVTNKNARGWGDFPGMETNLERTCDGLDTLLKYKAYRNANPLEIVKLWGYTA
jgi:squalene cyclase